MNLGEILLWEKDLRNKINNMNDTEKLDYITNLLNKDVDMFESGSDTMGVDFTDDFEKKEREINVFLEAMGK